MRIILLSILTFSFLTALSAQKKQALSPRLSPFQKTEIKIGIVDVELEYSRPSIRGRKIFGGLVPYGEIWRTGANRNTKITFHNDVIINTTKLKAGTYSIFTKPNQEEWQIYIYTLLDEFGAPEILNPEKIVLQFSVPVLKRDRALETLAINFENFKSNSAILSISWENVYVQILIKSPTADIIEQELFTANTGLAGDYESAAWTYFEYEKDYKKALAAINKCIAQMEKEEPLDLWLKEGNMDNPNRPRRYLLRAEILEVLGNKAQAKVSAQQAMEIAELIKSESYIERITEILERL